jgi:hypothetical protein
MALGKDASLQEIVTALGELIDRMGSGQQHWRVLPYGRDAQDRLMVNVITGNTSASLNYGNTSGVAPVWHANGGPNSMDAREQARELSMQTFNQYRNSRWVIS